MRGKTEGLFPLFLYLVLVLIFLAHWRLSVSLLKTIINSVFSVLIQNNPLTSTLSKTAVVISFKLTLKDNVVRIY